MNRFAPKPQQTGPRPFAWSYSRLKNFEVCPKKHFHVDIKKDVKEEESEQLQWGNEVHAALANAISKGDPLPPAFQRYAHWVERVQQGAGETRVELELAITSAFEPCEWFGRDAWFRAKVDVMKVNGAVALAGDWKTGKIVEDSVQLALTAQCVFSHYPVIQKIRTEFIWLKADATSREDFSRADMPELWAALGPRVEQLEHAHKTGEYPAKPGALCKRYCPVKSCAHHGG